ncbi:MAG TPA: molybdopterin dinucleotide binding domain-containing protein, partial [Acidimicrobiales bacterium]|nr:molybdopterin dinucleotide binding domain-containing protein [Acidimicrobiales bacterium]
PGIASAETHMTPPNLLSGSGAGRRFAAGPRPGLPGGEVEGRRNAPGEPGPAGALPDDPGAAGRPGPWAPSPVLIGSPGGTEVGQARPAQLPPAMGRHEPAAADPPPPPPHGTLRLVATRHLWDAGTLVAHCPHLAGLPREPAVGVHPDTLAALGVTPGSAVRVSSPQGELTLTATADPGLAPDCAAVAVNLPGASATALIDASRPVTDVTVNPATTPVATEPGRG